MATLTTEQLYTRTEELVAEIRSLKAEVPTASGERAAQINVRLVNILKEAGVILDAVHLRALDLDAKTTVC